MKTFKMLVLTDHRGHSAENALYALVQAMRLHPQCAQLDIATRGNNLNDYFFKEVLSQHIYATAVSESFKFQKDGQFYVQKLRKMPLAEYDVIWLRLPPPLSPSFCRFLNLQFSNAIIMNAPDGIIETGSKAFLMHFKKLCPPMQLCTSIEDIENFRKRFSIVLKPLREYGGKGIIKIEGDTVWKGKESTPFSAFIEEIRHHKIEYLGVQYLENVTQGDKRIVVVNGKILGAALRLPAKGSWLCNVAMGGNSNPSEINDEERAIVKAINPILTEKGIVMYGVDTLVGNDGKRVLSEINTTSIGGFPQIGEMSGKPVVEWAVDGIVNYIQKNKK